MALFPRAKSLILVWALIVPLAFALFTNHAWEDYYITLRSSRNLVEGHGLVFTPGERLHTFTSPLGVLLPALCTYLVGPHHEAAALWLFRCISISLLVAGAALLWQRSETLRFGAVGRVTLFGLLLLDPKLIDFSINGMETAILVFFLLLLWFELESPVSPRPGGVGFACAGLMWTRPDAFVLAGVLIVSRIIFRKDAPPAALPLARGILLGALVYLPWFLWAWWYYGSPIPHTIIAKAAFTPPVSLREVLLLPLRALTGEGAGVDLFLPAYWTFGGWPRWLEHCAQVLNAVATFGWLIPGVPVTGRRASLAVFLGMFYFSSIILFPWYVPPWTVIAAVVIATIMDRAYTSCVSAKRQPAAIGLRLVCMLLVFLQAGQLIAVAWQMRAQQLIVENGVRRSIGEWLAQNARKGDTVFLEPLGYIGYFSQLKTYDFPGLSSKEVVAEVRRGVFGYAELIKRLQPDWVVLRPAEANRPEFGRNPVLNNYDLSYGWNAVPQLEALAVLPGRPWCEFEAQYLVLRRITRPLETTQ